MYVCANLSLSLSAHISVVIWMLCNFTMVDMAAYQMDTHTLSHTHMHTHRIIAIVRLDESTKAGPFNYIYKHSLKALAVSLEQDFTS